MAKSESYKITLIRQLWILAFTTTDEVQQLGCAKKETKTCLTIFTFNVLTKKLYLHRNKKMLEEY